MTPRIARPLLGVVLVGFVFAMPTLVGSNYWLNLLHLAISFAIVALGINVVLGYAGQLTLAQAAFWGVGAYTSAILMTKAGWSFWPAIVAAFVVAAFFGVLLGIPTLKLTGHYLAMTTIGFGIILQLVLINEIPLTNGSDGITQIPSPWSGPWELKDSSSFFYLAGIMLLLIVWGTIRLKNSRVGRAFLAVRENEMAAETMGIDTTFFKVLAFALAAGLAGVGGSLFASSGSHFISPDTFSFDQSVVLLVMAVLGGSGSAVGAVVGAVLLQLVPEVLRFLKDSYLMFYAAAIILVMIFMPGGIAGLVYQLPFAARVREWWSKDAPATKQIAAARTATWSGVATNGKANGKAGHAPVAASGEAEVVLAVKGLVKQFGGLRAVDGVDMVVRRGEIQALIGPNGSGKTTILNMLSGLYGPTGGAIMFKGHDVAGWRPHRITDRGIARTFQNIRLFGELTALDNVLIGQHARSKAGVVRSIVQPPSQKTEEAALRASALEALAFVGLQGKELAIAKRLPYGQQRLLELARALVSQPELLLLDEPAAGLNGQETEALVELLYQIRDRGVTILLVEHDMSLVMNVSDHITVLNFGKKIAEGPAAQIEANQEVIDAYLGTEVSYA